MRLLWKIRYLDTRDRQFKDRYRFLDTQLLDAATKAAVELCYELEPAGAKRSMLKYRQRFQDLNESDGSLENFFAQEPMPSTFFVDGYFENENGDVLTDKQMAVALTGNPDAVMFPPWATKHDIELALTPKRPIPIDQITMSQEQLDVLGYFARDVREMRGAALYSEGPGTIGTVAGGPPALETAITDEEIRSFVTIFRRLYMENEPANFLKAVAVFADAAQGYPLIKWVQGVAGQYSGELDTSPQWTPFAGNVSADR